MRERWRPGKQKVGGRLVSEALPSTEAPFLSYVHLRMAKSSIFFVLLPDSCLFLKCTMFMKNVGFLY